MSAENGPARDGSLAWLAWAAAGAAALVFVLLLAANVPYWDEWELVPLVTGHQPLTPEYLWSQHNEHRIPLPRLIYAGLFALTHDFRSGAVFEVLVLVGAAALLIATARRLRGRGSWVDAVFPLVLLNCGHAENLLWSFQLAMTLYPVLLAVTLTAAAGLDRQPRRSQLVALAAPMLLAPLCGAPGVVLAAGAGSWLLWCVVRPGSRQRALALVLGLSCWGLIAAYLYRYAPVPGHPGPAPADKAIQSVGEVMTLAFGAAGAWHSPWTLPLTIAIVVVTLAGVGAWWLRSPDDRVPAEALLAIGGEIVLLVGTIGWGRSGFGPGAGTAGRYAALAAPLVCWVCLAWCRLPWRSAGRIVQAVCCLAALVLYPDNLTAGRELGEQRRAKLQALVRDVRRPGPLEDVAGRHNETVYPNAAALQEWLETLRLQRLGPFSRADQVAPLQRRFPFVTPPLIEVRDGVVAAYPSHIYGRDAVVVHADGDLVFDVRPGLREVSGYIGVDPQYANRSGIPGEPVYDGTAFEATFYSDAGEETALFSRVLDPLRNPHDRGFVPFRSPIPQSGGRLVLSTRSGRPGGDANRFGDWGSWAGIELR